MLLDAEVEAMIQAYSTEDPPTESSNTRKAPTCKKCGDPMKGHKKGLCTAAAEPSS